MGRTTVSMNSRTWWRSSSSSGGKLKSMAMAAVLQTSALDQRPEGGLCYNSPHARPDPGAGSAVRRAARPDHRRGVGLADRLRAVAARRRVLQRRHPLPPRGQLPGRRPGVRQPARRSPSPARWCPTRCTPRCGRSCWPAPASSACAATSCHQLVACLVGAATIFMVGVAGPGGVRRGSGSSPPPSPRCTPTCGSTSGSCCPNRRAVLDRDPHLARLPVPPPA